VRDQFYDALGQLSGDTYPYEPGKLPVTFTTEHDVLGRAIIVHIPNGATIYSQYAGRNLGGGTLVQTDARGFKTTTITDMHGNTLSVTDAKGGKTIYSYDADGHPRTITDAVGAVIRYTYDEVGNRESIADPDLGLWHYVYDALGRLVEQNWTGQL
jgi:YD repeat-containing protein